MGQTVYADLLFLINFCMDYLCFYITAKLLRRPQKRLRALLASVGGGVYSVAILFAGFVPPLELVCDIGAGIVMCACVFTGKKVNFGRFLLCSLVYVGVSAALGGLMTAIFNMLNLLGLPLGSITDSDGMPVWLFALLAAISGAATLAGGRFFKRKQAERSADVDVTLNGKTVRLSAFCDSGNLLRDPVNGRCVVLADISAVKNAFPEQILRAVRKNDASVLTKLTPETARRLHLIPARTATGGGMLYAIKPDKITVTPPGERPHDVDALVAVSALTGESHGFQAIIPPELMV